MRTIHNTARATAAGDFCEELTRRQHAAGASPVEDSVEAAPDTLGTDGAGRRTVAVVDGDEAVRQSLGLLLGSLHLRVETFPSGETFLDALDGFSPDCVITEVFLPGMSGIDLLRQLTARGRAVPAIVMATHADIPLAVEAMHLGALDFVEKPVIDRVIVTRVREALRN